MLGIGEYFWRLIPANPILLRVVETGGKRRRDLLIRCAYLGLLVLVVVLSLLSRNTAVGSTSLNELAKQSAAIFRTMSYLQLGLVALLAPIFTAGAITQEKDSQTYDILLSTPLSNGQVVLGSLLSRLFFVIALLISGIPIFSITQIFGGVAISSIARSFGIAAATAFVTGALAMAIAVLKVGTRRTIFSFYLFIIIYLVGVYLLDGLDFFKVIIGRDATTGLPILSKTSWLTGIHPFLSLAVVFNNPNYLPPEPGDLPAQFNHWPFNVYLSNPAGFYTGGMFLLSFVLVTPSILLLRRLAQTNTSFKSWVLQKVHLSTGDRNRKPRMVWSNPIAWREAKTKASAARASLLRYGFMAAGLIGALVLVVFYSMERPVDSYIDANSYNEQSHTLTVYHPDRAPEILVVARSAEVKLGDEIAEIGNLRRKLQVAASAGIPGQNASGAPAARGSRQWLTITATPIPRRVSVSDARKFLLGMVTVEFAVILLIVTNAAASTVTREKEDGTLDLLLATPITSHYYIWGKLRGLVSFVLPLIAVPVVSSAVFILYDFFRRAGLWRDPAFEWIVFPEAVLLMPGVLIIVAAFAAIVGMQMSLRCRTTVMAVMSSVGIVVGLCAVMGWCGFQMLSSRNTGEAALVFGSFSPFTILTLLIDPYSFTNEMFTSGPVAVEQIQERMIVFIVSWIAVAVYTAVVWSMYRSMVKNFDMTIRKQSR